jgi:hypothetical protein
LTEKIMEDLQARQQALANLREIVKIIRAVHAAIDDQQREAALMRLYEHPLSVEVRGDWHAPNEEQGKAAEFRILLGTGGPAVRIRGKLDGNGKPKDAHIEYQDWFTPWEPLTDTTDAEDDALHAYCCNLPCADY